MKIGAIFTGGTIGSSVGEDGYISVNKSHYKLLEMYYEQYDIKHDNEFVIANPYSILSENLDFDNVESLVECVEQMQSKDLDGIIVMHGTDTLQYSAAFLYYLVRDIKIPIILVSSAYVLDDPRANGLGNFKLAIDYIEQLHIPGVFVSYVNSDGRAFIHAADKIEAHKVFASDIYSIGNNYFAEAINGKLQLNSPADEQPRGITAEKRFDRKKVLFCHVYPGMEFMQNVDEADVILIESYHSGTVSVDNRMKVIASKARDKGIPIYIVGIKSAAGQYETVKSYEELGMIPLYDEAPIAAYCRLSYGIVHRR